MQVSHNNHSVPKWYLKRWADRDGHIWCCPLLVPHEEVPEWDQRHVSGVAYRRDLYTLTKKGTDLDDFERWLTTKYEDPASAVVAKAVAGHKLTAGDWRILVLFAVAQDLRTPQHFIEGMERWREQFPDVIQKTLEDAVRRIEELHKSGETLPAPKTGAQPLGDAFQFSVRPNAHPETGQGEIGVHVLVGRDFWLREQRYVLEGIAETFVRHSWCIADSAKGIEWFTTDHPVVKLNWHADGKYDVKGGWGRPGGYICMPLSRKRLLFTKIGEDLPHRLHLTKQQTVAIREAVAARAWRTVFALRPVPDLDRLRPRVVNAESYRHEEEQWAQWHSGQTLDEQEHFGDR